MRGFLSSSFLIISVVAVVLALGNSLPCGASNPISFEERVKAQEAIERVYYSHRIWPADNPVAKPPFEQVVSRKALEQKVSDYLLKSAAIEQLWQRPITSGQIQAELERIVRDSKDLGTLQELFAALEGDPSKIAECLARPILADRLIRNWYASDSRFHSSARSSAQAAFRTSASGDPSSLESGAAICGRVRYVLEGQDSDGPGASDSIDGLHIVAVSADELAKLRSGSARVGDITFQELRDAFLVARTTVLEDSFIEREVAYFPKTPFDSWWASESSRLKLNPPAAQGKWAIYHLPESGPGPAAVCPDAWLNSNLDDIPDPRFGHTAVWTGTEMIVWGGGPNYYRTGGQYNPATDTWIPTSTGANCPSGRQFHTAVWTGTNMVIWGGYDGTTNTSYLNTGGIYDPATSNWVATSTTEAPAPRQRHTAVWTGTQMVVWGGFGCTNSPTCSSFGYLSDGGIFTPDAGSGTWSATSLADAPTGREYHTAIWAASQGKMIVWGGYSGAAQLNSGGLYDPGANSWTATGTGANCPTARQEHSAVWTGSAMIIWGGEGSATGKVNTGAIYDPVGTSWTATSTGTNCPTARKLHSAVWTGDRMIVWGGNDLQTGSQVNSGGSYDPILDAWTITSTGTNCPSGRQEHTAVWATWGAPATSAMIVWGGYKTNSSGGIYYLSSDTWTPTSMGANNPLARTYHTALWTGAEMIVWGGENLPLVQENSGGIYNFATAAWTPTSTASPCPLKRRYHTAVWTGTEMVVWGGTWFDGTNHFLNDGGRYNPSTNSWATMASTTLVARHRHTAVWTGTEMWMWGGQDSGGETGTYTNTGGRYSPSADTWTAMSTASAPSARRDHTAVWTGTHMVVWGGFNTAPINTGARYSVDTWTALAAGPSARFGHSAVWAPEVGEMIVWGGEAQTGVVKDGSRWKPAKIVTLDAAVTVAAEAWKAITAGSVPSGFSARRSHSAVWSGQEALTWGGIYVASPKSLLKDDGYRYNPNLTWVPSTKTYTDGWTAMTQGPYTPPPREKHTAVWVPPLETNPWYGTRMIVWGGEGPMSSGGVYEPPPPVIGFYEACGTTAVTLSTAVYPPQIPPLKTYQWIVNGTDITDATDRTYSVSQADPFMDWEADYNVRVTLPGGSVCEGVPHHVSLWSSPTPTISRGVVYSWDFGDGGTSNLQNPRHAYASTGSYNWTLTTTGTPACSKSGTITITGGCSVNCSATAPYSGAAGAPVNFQAAASPSGCAGGATYAWDFGDTQTSTLQNPSNIYAAAGTYTWIMTATVDGVTCIQTGAIVISDMCVQTCLASAPTSCSVGAAVQFQSSAVPATNCTGLSGGSGTATNPRTGCTSPGAQLKCDQTYKGYQWKRGGVSITGAVAQTYTATVSGIYTVQVVDSHGCVSISDPYYVTIYTNPVPVISGIIMETCETRLTTTEAFETYQWKLAGANISGATDSIYMASANGAYTVTVTDIHGCAGTSPVNYTVANYPVPAVSSVPTSAACIDETPGVAEATLTATCPTCLNPPIIGYQWLLDGAPISGATDSTYIFDAPTTGVYRFKVQIIDNLGCSGTLATDKVITINALPTPTIDGPTFPVCEANLSTTIAHTTYQWYLDGTAISGATARNYLAKIGGPYTVRVTNSFGCQATSPPFEVQIFDIAVPPITGPNNGCTVPGVTITTDPAIAYQWNLDGLPITGATNQSYTATESGFHNYTVTVQDLNGCVPTSNSYWVNLDPPHPDIFTTADKLWVANGAVNAEAVSDGVLYLGGDFSYVGPPTLFGVALDSGTGSVVPQWPEVNGVVLTTVPDGSGGWFVGGTFSKVGGYTRQNIAHIRSDKTVDPAFFPNPGSSVRAIAISGGTLYLGGDFTTVCGQTRNRVAAIDLATGQLAAWNPNSAGVVRAIAASGTSVYLGGEFLMMGGQTRNRIAAVDAISGQLQAWSPNAGSIVRAMVVSGSIIYVGGDFTTIGGASRNRIAAIDLTTGSATAWNPNAGGLIRAIKIDGTKVYIGGEFTTVNGSVVRNRIAALDSTLDTANVTAWNPSATGGTGTIAVNAIDIVGTTLYAGGNFTSIGGSSRNYIAALDTTIDTNQATSWNPNSGGAVNAVAATGTMVYLGSSFASVGGVNRNRLAALDLSTGQATGWNPNAGASVKAVAVSGSTVYAGGDFTTIGGQTRNRIAAIDAATGVATAWNPNSSAVVRAILLSGSTVYVGGDFTSIGGQTRNRIAALNAAVDSNNATTWNPNANGSVLSLALSGTIMYVGGSFTSIGGQTRNRIAALDTTVDTNQATAWNPNSNNSVRALVVSGTTVYAGGDFTTMNGSVARNRIAALDAALDTNNLKSWNPNAGSNVYALALSGTRLYAGGIFTSVGGATRNRIAALDTTVDTNQATAWNPDSSAAVNSLVVDGAVLYAGGAFSTIKGYSLPNAAAIYLEGAQIPCGSVFQLSTQPFLGYQWKRDGSPLGGATGQSYSPTSSGTYSLEVAGANGCTGISADYPLAIASCAVSEVSPSGSAFPARLGADQSSSTGFYLYFQKMDGAEGYNLYEGSLGTWYSHGNAAGNVCNLTCTDLGTGEMRAEVTPSAGDRYYLITAFAAGAEGASGYSYPAAQQIDPAQSTCSP